MKPRVVVLNGPLQGRTLDIPEGGLTIGRGAGSGLVLDDPAASRDHCTIRRDGLHYRLEDLGSRHGTLVNGKRTTGRPLDHGDRVGVGDTEVRFLILPDGGADVSSGPTERSHASTPVVMSVRHADVVAGTTTTMPVTGSFLPHAEDRPQGADAAARLARDLSALLSITQAVASMRDAARLEERILDRLFDVVPAERAGILLLPRHPNDGTEADDFTSVVALGRSGTAPSEVHLPRSVALQVVQERVAVLSNDVLATPRWDRSESLRAARISSLLCVPLVLYDRVLGVLYLDTRSADERFDEMHLRLVTAVASVAAIALDNAEQVDRLVAENRRLVQDVADRHGMVGASKKMEDVRRLIERVAAADSTVLIVGESGTGKELVAHAIHRASPRSEKPFVALNCAAIPETLLESEMFGHEKGAFSGAVARKIGRIEQADEGTLFLDEIGEMPLALQAKLLRAIQERVVDRVGGSKPVRVDVRFLAATHVDLEKAVKEGRFREDLFYRIHVLPLPLPPLRDRREDIPALVAHFAAAAAAKLGRKAPELSQAASTLLARHDWPGNVRELANVVERAVVLGLSDVIEADDLPESLIEGAGGPAPDGEAGYHAEVAEAKRAIVRKALEETRGRVTDAARRLHLNANYLHRLMTNLGLR